LRDPLRATKIVFKVDERRDGLMRIFFACPR
jgi:hypothetical protein